MGHGAPVRPRTRNVPSHEASGSAGEALMGTEARAISLVEAFWNMKLRSSHGTIDLVALTRWTASELRNICGRLYSSLW